MGSDLAHAATPADRPSLAELPDRWLRATGDAESLTGYLRGQARRIVRDRVTAMLAPGVVLDGFSVRRVKVRPGASIEMWIDASLRSSTGRSGRPAALRWSTSSVEVLSNGSDNWFGELGSGSSPSVRVSPFDPEFPNLACLLDLDRREVSSALGLGADAVVSVRSVRYRPGQRHVLRFGVSEVERRRRGVWFAKLARPGQAREVFEAASRFARSVDGDPSVAVVAPVAMVDDSLVYPSVRGTALSSLSPTDARGAHWFVHAGRALAVVHGSAMASGSRLRSLDAELATTGRAVGHLRPWLPAGTHRIDDLLGRLAVLVARVPVAPIGSLHGDCKLDHLHRKASVMHLIDIDNAGHGETALDVGNLLADLRWSARDRSPEEVEARRRSIIEGYGPAAAQPRVALVEAISLLRITARRPRVDRPGWIAASDDGLRSVEQLVAWLEELGDL